MQVEQGVNARRFGCVAPACFPTNPKQASVKSQSASAKATDQRRAGTLPACGVPSHAARVCAAKRTHPSWASRATPAGVAAMPSRHRARSVHSSVDAASIELPRSHARDACTSATSRAITTDSALSRICRLAARSGCVLGVKQLCDRPGLAHHVRRRGQLRVRAEREQGAASGAND